MTLAEKQYEAAKTEANRVMQEKKDSINFEAEMLKALAGLETAKANYEEAKVAVEKKQNALAKAKAQAKYEIEIAEMQAEIDLMSKKQSFISEQEKMNKVLAGLEEKAEAEALLLNNNAGSIMKGGWFTNADGSQKYYNESYNVSYRDNNSSTYVHGTYNSIIALMGEIAKQNTNLLKWEAKLIDVEAYINGETAENNQKIELANALIANYKELQTANSYEAVVKKYEEAKKNVDVYQAKVATAAIEKREAFEAYKAYMEAETENEVLAYIAENKNQYGNVDYMTHTSIHSNDCNIEETVYKYDENTDWDNILGQAKDAIETAQGNVETREGLYETLKKQIANDIKTNEPLVGDAKATLKKKQDALAALKAEADYVTLAEAVATAQAAYDEAPSTTTLNALNLAKQNAEAYVGAGTESVGYLEEYLFENCVQQVDGENVGYEAYVAHIEAELAGLKAIDEDAEVELKWMEQNSTNYNTPETLAELNEAVTEEEEDLADLEALKEMFAEDSEAMVAYNEWVDGLKELIEAYDAIEDYSSESSTWESLKNSLEDYVTSDTNNIGHFDYDAKIAEQEAIIAAAKDAIAKLPLKNESGYDYNDATYDEQIKLAEAKIAAMEAELEARQAEYDAIMKELDELVKAETETEGAE